MLKRNGQTYQGQEVDLFALGCMLFVLRSSFMPFDVNAQSSDLVYKFFDLNRVDKFWELHERGRESGFFSPQFKDLVSQMLHCSPQHRPMLPEIIAHPWLQGRTPTRNQIRYELEEWKECLNNRAFTLFQKEYESDQGDQES